MRVQEHEDENDDVCCAVRGRCCGSVSASPTNKFDLNNDGKVDGRDAAQLIMMVGNTGATGSMPAMPGAAEDVNGDGMFSLADWREFVRYVSSVGAYPEGLFDVSIQWGQPTGVNAADKMAIAQATSSGRFGSATTRCATTSTLTARST